MDLGNGKIDHYSQKKMKKNKKNQIVRGQKVRRKKERKSKFIYKEEINNETSFLTTDYPMKLASTDLPLQIHPRNHKQKEYYSYLRNNNICVICAIGSAGTGKTIMACQMGIINLFTKKVDKIIITRPTVPADEDIGFLPGTLEEKMAPWLVPIFDIFHEYYSVAEVKRMCEDKIIEITPLAYMRGRTLKNAWIIADEMQNTTINQMKMILTRIGENSKLVCTGDPKQHDRLKHRYEINGLQDFTNKIQNAVNKSSKIKLIEFTRKDVVRSAIVKEILELYGE